MPECDWGDDVNGVMLRLLCNFREVLDGTRGREHDVRLSYGFR